MTVQQQPSTNPFLQVAGLGIMGLGAYKGFNTQGAQQLVGQ